MVVVLVVRIIGTARTHLSLYLVALKGVIIARKNDSRKAAKVFKVGDCISQSNNKKYTTETNSNKPQFSRVLNI
jgi:hypothetical protein